jgi:hypothetical protein
MNCRAAIQIARSPRPIPSILAGFAEGYIGRIFDEPRDHQNRERTDRDINVERPSLGVLVGEIATERWPEHRGHDHTQSKHGHGLPALGGRETFEQNGLRERLQRSAAGALQRARHQDEAEAAGRSAKERRMRP